MPANILDVPFSRHPAPACGLWVEEECCDEDSCNSICTSSTMMRASPTPVPYPMMGAANRLLLAEEQKLVDIEKPHHHDVRSMVVDSRFFFLSLMPDLFVTDNTFCVPPIVPYTQVLCGRGVTTNRHPGNESFRSLVSLNKVSHRARLKLG